MKRNKVFQFLASLRLAVVLFVMFVVILASATFYESAYDTATAQHLVYKSPFFALFLALFFLNILCSTMIRFPWKKKQIGFVMTHAGILLLLFGAALTMVNGVDGSMMVQEGESSSKVLLNEPVFFLGRPGEPLKETSAEFRWIAPTSERPSRVVLGEGIEAEVHRYLHHAQLKTFFEKTDKGVPALEMRIFNERVDQNLWLNAGQGDVPMGPAKFRLLRASSPEHLKGLLEGKSTGRGELQLLVGGQPMTLQASDLVEGKSVPCGDYEIELKRYLPHALVKNNQLVSEDDVPVNPCLELRVHNKQGDWQDWLLFSALPQLNTRTGSHGKEMPLRVLYVWDSPTAEGHSLSLIVGPKQELYARVDDQPARSLELGKTVPTGWMNLQFEVKQFLPSAREVREYEPVEVEKGEEQSGPPPAIQVRFQGAKEGDLQWMERGDVKQVHTSSGQPLVVGYAYRSVDLGFKVHLKHFQIDYDPGTSNPAAFKSQVDVGGQDFLIEMNEPLVRDGYKLFQSSYSQVPGQPTISVFTVARDPGIWWKYIGSVLVCVGIAVMFVMKPYAVKGNRESLPRKKPDPEIE